ncbi:MAG: Sensor histidine kinase RcsC [Thermoanaerobaculia bacterium]|nr:Sensor histidine kinase RcsC [Thermoanaerobaculia bacterium]
MTGTLRWHQSIVTRLTLMVAGILAAAVLGVGGLALIQQQRHLSQALETKASGLVRFMAQVSPLGILSLNFVEMNNNVKKAVQTDSEAVYAVILNEQGIPLVHFFKDADPSVTHEARELIGARRPLDAMEAIRRTGMILEVSAPILAGERHIGTVTLGFSFERLRRALAFQIAAIGLVLAGILGLSLALSRLVLKGLLLPVRTLTSAAAQISAGNLDAELTGMDRVDELGILSRAFESMTRQLRQLIAGLQQRVVELKNAGLALRESEEKYRTIFLNSPLGIFRSTSDGRLVEVNPALARMLGYDSPEAVVREIHDIGLIHVRAEDSQGEAGSQQNAPDTSQHINRYRRKDGSEFVASLYQRTVRDDQGQPVFLEGIVEDVTERKRAERQIFLMNFALNSVTEAAFLTDSEARFQFVNEEACRSLGYSREELLGMGVADVDPNFPVDRWTSHWSELEERRSFIFESRHRGRDGRVIPVEIAVNYFEYDGKSYNLALVRDISERKRTEESLRRLNRELRAISDCNQVLVRAEDEGTLLNEICRIVCDKAGYRMAWVGYAESDLAKTVRPVAWAGVEEGYLAAGGFTWEDVERGRGPIGTAIRRGESCCIQDFATDPRGLPWREDALERGYRSSIALPLKNNDAVTFGALCIYSQAPDAFTPEEVALLEELAGDLAFGISVLRNRMELRKAERERLDHLHFLESMDRVNRAIQGTSDLEKLMCGVLEAALSIFDCDRASLIHPCDPDSATWRVPMERTRPGQADSPGREAEFPLDAEFRSVFETLLASSGPVPFGEASEHPVPDALAGRFGTKSLLAISVHPNVDKPYFFGLHQSSHPRVWTVDEMRLFQETCRRLADGLTSLIVYGNLWKSERHLEDAQRMARIGSWDRDLDAERIMLSDEALRIFGLSPQERLYDLTQWHDRWLQLVHPEDRGRTNQAYVDALGGGPAYDVEYRVVRPDGAVRIVHSVAKVVRDEQGRARHVFGTMQDVTERKQAEAAQRESEERYRTIFQNSPLGIFRSTFEGRFLEVNPALARMFGYDEPETIVREIRDIGEQLYVHAGARREIVAGQLSSPDTKLFVTRFRRRDGGEFLANQYLRTIRDAGGRPLFFEGIVEDITERKRAEDEREKLQAQLAQAQKMESIGRLAGGVAHDFNNMLSVIIGYTDLALSDEGLDQTLSANLEEIRKAASRSADLTRQLLAFARKQTIAPKVLDLNETVESMLKLLRRLIGEDINLVWLPGTALWPVYVDPTQVDQILANLCVNARDAISGVGKVTIETHAVTLDEAGCAGHLGQTPGDYVLLAVSDNGCGMAKETLDRLFEPFFTTKGRGKGTGLGLATVYGIVRQNNGFINVYSEPGHGSTFRIYLPRHVSEAGQMREEPTCGALGGKETILLVEDEPAILAMARKVLESLGYKVLAASSPREAIRTVEEHAGEIHLLITDVVMPEMNGRDLARNLTPHHPEMRRLFMSGYTGDVIADHGLLDEGVAFLQKPFSIHDLATRVRKALDGE